MLVTISTERISYYTGVNYKMGDTTKVLLPWTDGTGAVKEVSQLLAAGHATGHLKSSQTEKGVLSTVSMEMKAYIYNDDKGDDITVTDIRKIWQTTQNFTIQKW